MKPPSGMPHMPLVHDGVGDDARILAARQVLLDNGASYASVQGTGPNGPEIVGLSGNWSVAQKILTSLRDGDAVGVFQNTDTGHFIDFHWGWTTPNPKDKGQGLAKLLQWHPEVVAELDQIVARSVVVGEQTPDRYVLSDGAHLLIVSQRYFDQEKRWLVTAFDPGERPSKSYRAYLMEAGKKVSQAAPQTVDGGRVSGQADASISGTSSTDRLAKNEVAPIPPKINAKSIDGPEDQSPDT
ncbi:MAG: hypothetical protein RLZZ157_1088 [Pseudomonadota bacterium]|jgi:hypothetical protein